MLDMEETAFRLVGAMEIAANRASPGEMDEEVVRLIADYAVVANTALKATSSRIGALGAEPSESRRLRFDLADGFGLESGKEFEAWGEAFTMGPLKLLHKADRQLRGGVQDRIRRFDEDAPTCSNQ